MRAPLFALLFLCGLAPSPAAPPNPDAAATIVVFNPTDPDSPALAKFYAEQRGIPAEQVLGLPCAVREEITREEYENNLAEPLRRAGTARGWWKLRELSDPHGPVESNRIRFLALIRGVPLKIAPVATWPGDKTDPATPVGQQNAAAVDSELALVAVRTRQISGLLPNPYFRGFLPIREANQPALILVARLDGPTPETVRRMITDSIAAERTGLQGMAYLDARGLGPDQPGLQEGDQWILQSATEARRMGLPAVLDNGPAMFPEAYPMRHAALYLGWYAENVSASFLEPSFRFDPGAVAVHIHSFSASTVRDAKRNWVGPLLQRGAAATLGNVYEPYLGFTPQLNIFVERLRLGFTFAEAAYMSQRVLSWMGTVVGDPLYRPFPQMPEAAPGPEWAAYRKSAPRWQEDAPGVTQELQTAARAQKSGLLWEALALLQMGANDRPGALASLKEARTAYTDRADILRVVIHEVMQLRGAGNREEEINALVKEQAAKAKGAPALAVLRLLAPAAFGPGKK